RIRQKCWLYKRQIVCRGVVFRILAVRTPHEAANWQIEPRRTELPLVIAIRNKVYYVELLAGMFENVESCAVNLCISFAGLLVGGSAGIADTRKHESMADPRDYMFVSGKPCDGTNRGRDK